MPVTKTIAAERAHYQLVINDPDYWEDLRTATDKDAVSKRYGLTPDYTMMSVNDYKLTKDGYYPIIGGWFKFDKGRDKFTVLLNANAKKSDVLGLWEHLQRYRETNGANERSKVKLPDDSELLYAIFKARVRGHTFPQIFDMYRTGTLPSYENKPTNNFATEFDMKKYYSRYYNPI